MPRNGSGTFNRIYNWTTDAGNGIDIEASRMDGEFDGLATGLSNSIAKDGQTTITANIPFNSKKITGIANGSARTDSIALGQVQDNSYGTLGTLGGSADTYTANPSPAITAYATGMEFNLKVNATNTGASTLNVSAIGAKDIKKYDGAGSKLDIGFGDLPINQYVKVIYDGTDFVLRDAVKQKGNKNLIINGDFEIAQRGTSFTSVGNDTYTSDRFRYIKSGAMVHDISQNSDVPTVTQAGRYIPNSLLIDCTTIDSSIGAGDYAAIEQKIEGYNFQAIAQKTFTLSFWVKATKTGTYCAAFRNTGVDRSYVAEYTINSANTWEYKTITVSSSPSAGTWNYNNGIGLHVAFLLATGSTFQTTAGSWQTGNYFGTSNQVNACDNVSNDFRIASVQVEAGSVATEFEKRSIQQEENLSYRYYETGLTGFSGDTDGSNLVYNQNFKVSKRALASMSVTLQNATNISTIATGAGVSVNSFQINISPSGSGFTRHFDSSWIANAEL
jgi:hypothetical protein